MNIFSKLTPKLKKGLVVFVALTSIAGITVTAIKLNKKDAYEVEISANAVEDTMVEIHPDLKQDIPLKNGMGVNISVLAFNYMYNENYTNIPNLELKMLKYFDELNVKTMRVPFGCEIDKYDWANTSNWKTSRKDKAYPPVENILTFAEKADTDVIFEMSVLGQLEGNLKEKEWVGCKDTKSVAKWTDEEIRDFVRKYTVERYNKGQSYIKYYELGNEEWLVNVDGTELEVKDYIKAANKVKSIINSETSKYNIPVKTLVVAGHGTDIWGEDEYTWNNNKNFDSLTLHSYYHERTFVTNQSPRSLYDIDKYHQNIFNKFDNKFSKIPKYQKPAITEWNFTYWNYFGNVGPQPNIDRYEHTLFTLGYMMKLVKEDYEIENYAALASHLTLLGKTEYSFINNELINYDNSINDLRYTASGKGYKVFADHTLDKKLTHELVGTTSEDGDFIIQTTGDGLTKASIIIMNRDKSDTNGISIKLDNKYFGKTKVTKMSAPYLASTSDKITFTTISDKVEDTDTLSFDIKPLNVIIIETNMIPEPKNTGNPTETTPQPDPVPEPQAKSQRQAKTEIDVMAAADIWPAINGEPCMDIRKNGRSIFLGTSNYNSSCPIKITNDIKSDGFKFYNITINKKVEASGLEFHFLNEAYGGSSDKDRNLIINGVKINNKWYSMSKNNVYSVGSWDSVNKCGGGYKKKTKLNCSNAYFKLP